jgi:hypothetical protein
MTYEDRLSQPNRLPDFNDIVGVSVEAAVFFGVVGAQIGFASADMIKQNGLKPVLERRRNEAPHILVTAKTMGEDNRTLPCAVYRYVIAVKYRHSGFPMVGIQ